VRYDHYEAELSLFFSILFGLLLMGGDSSSTVWSQRVFSKAVWRLVKLFCKARRSQYNVGKAFFFVAR